MRIFLIEIEKKTLIRTEIYDNYEIIETNKYLSFGMKRIQVISNTEPSETSLSFSQPQRLFNDSFRSIKHKSPIASHRSHTEQNSPDKSQDLNKGSKINKVLQRELDKLKITNRGKLQKFEENIKVFEQLSTFIDIKDYLQQMNDINKNPKSTRGLHYLPPIVTSKSNLLDKKIHDPKNKSCDIEKTLEDVREFMTNRVKPRDVRLKIDLSNPAVPEAVHLQTIAYMNEDENYDNFYASVDNALQFDEKEDLKKFTLNQEVVDENKEKYRFQPLDTKIDEEYYENYKSRADKIIFLLKVASKKIFNKTINRQEEVMREKNWEIQNGYSKPKATNRNRRATVKPKFDDFFESGKFLDGVDPPVESVAATLDLKLKTTQARVSKLLKNHETKTQEQALNPTRSEYAKNKFTEKKFNQKLNKIHNNFMIALVNKVELEEVHYKNLKHQFKKDINGIEESLNAQVDQIIPQPLQSIRQINLKEHSNRTFKRNPNKKVSGRIISVVV